MSRNMKILLFIVLPALATCCLLCVAVLFGSSWFLQRTVSGVSDPQAAKQVGAKIADYTLPSGYQEAMGMDLFAYQLVMIAPTSQRSGTGTVFMMMQYPTLSQGSVDPEMMNQQMRDAFDRQYQQSGTFAEVGERTVTIKGKPTTMTVSESTQSTSKMRQATAIFTGKGGLTMLMVMGSPNSWDWQMIENFCRSIR